MLLENLNENFDFTQFFGRKLNFFYEMKRNRKFDNIN